jgi:hypothetical protein
LTLFTKVESLTEQDEVEDEDEGTNEGIIEYFSP